MNTRAKFTCTQVEPKGDTEQSVYFMPVINDCEENKSFSKYTPSGSLQLYITNPDLVGAFEKGKEYFVDISPAN